MLSRMPAGAHQPGLGPDRRRSAHRLSAARLLASAATASVCVALAGCGGSQSRSVNAGVLSKLDVTLAAPRQLRTVTPQFALSDSLGHLVRLSQFRGKA